MISLSLDPVKCAYSKKFDMKINYRDINKNFNYLEYTGQALKISRVNVTTLVTRADFTEIKKSNIKFINVTGNLYLHDCMNEIEQVTASLDIFIFRCMKINFVAAKRDVYVIHLPPEYLPVCEYGEIYAERDNHAHYLVNQPSNFLRLENCSVERNFILDAEYKTIEVIGDCSKISQIVFTGNKYKDSERVVIIKKGAIFKGTVDGGNLIFEA